MQYSAALKPHNEAVTFRLLCTLIPGTLYVWCALYDSLLQAWSRFKGKHSTNFTFAAAGWYVFVPIASNVDTAVKGAPFDGQPAGMKPQSHYARARSTNGYTVYNEAGDTVIKGSTTWYGAPRCFKIARASYPTCCQRRRGTRYVSDV